jgi:pimeloyl-ACP methyl ester carboxylesterase
MSSIACTFDWYRDGRSIPVGYDVLGNGPSVLLLPAFSTVSTREEMAPLARRLAGELRTVAVDWPGFGRPVAPKLVHSPDLHFAFLAAFVESVLGGHAAVVAAGHAAGYVLRLARERPGVWSRIVLVAPTWRGPLPTMMGGYGRSRTAPETPFRRRWSDRLSIASMWRGWSSPPCIVATSTRTRTASRRSSWTKKWPWLDTRTGCMARRHSLLAPLTRCGTGILSWRSPHRRLRRPWSSMEPTHRLGPGRRGRPLRICPALRAACWAMVRSADPPHRPARGSWWSGRHANGPCNRVRLFLSVGCMLMNTDR